MSSCDKIALSQLIFLTYLFLRLSFEMSEYWKYIATHEILLIHCFVSRINRVT